MIKNLIMDQTSGPSDPACDSRLPNYYTKPETAENEQQKGRADGKFSKFSGKRSVWSKRSREDHTSLLRHVYLGIAVRKCGWNYNSEASAL